MGKVTLSKWKRFSAYHIGEIQTLCHLINNNNYVVLVLAKGHWKTGLWIPLELGIDKPVDIKELVEIISEQFKDKDPNFKLSD